MVYLILCTLGSTCNMLLIRYFREHKVSLPWIVALNYVVCVLCGGTSVVLVRGVPDAPPWLLYSLFQGVLFAGNFYLLIVGTWFSGVGPTALASRLSVAIPVLCAVPLFGEHLGTLRVVGLVLTTVSLWLLVYKSGKGERPKGWIGISLLPTIFLLFGIQFVLLKYVEHFYLSKEAHSEYVAFSCFFAFLFASLVALFFKKKDAERLSLRGTILGGLLLGSVNYLTIYSLTRVLSLDGWDSSMVYPVYGVGVVMLGALAGVTLFKESLTRRQLMGLLTGILAVVFLTN